MGRGQGLWVRAVSIAALLGMGLSLPGCSDGGGSSQDPTPTPTQTLSGYVLDEAVAGPTATTKSRRVKRSSTGLPPAAASSRTIRI
jgi:hypothetical protein